MNDKNKVKQIARNFLVESMYGTIYETKRQLRLAREEYYDRIKNIGHMDDKQQMDTKRRVADCIEEQMGVKIDIDPEQFDKVDDDGALLTKEMVRFGKNTKYLYIQCWEDGEVDTELNADAELLVSLIHEIVVGRY